MSFEFAVVLMNCGTHISDIVNVAVVHWLMRVSVDVIGVVVLLTGRIAAASLGSTASSGISCR